MRRRSLMLWTPVVFGLVLMLPATTAASNGLTHTVNHNYCLNTIVVQYKATYTAAGTSDADRLEIVSAANQKKNGIFHLVHSWPNVWLRFTPNGHSHSLSLSRAYAETAGHKVKIKFFFLAYKKDPSNPPDYVDLLEYQERDSVIC